ncbi:glycosyltransferase family 4 protein [Pantanalinema rosaneae CENA516]|uniref:glycosyltransferase family 4 protein n=1 Tax=Pantanalinema rosaneae TaxID=1620701 RepID=UPI003D6E05EC
MSRFASPLKLAFITATPQNTNQGSGTFVGNIHLIHQLRRQGHTVDVITPTHPVGKLGSTAHRFLWNWQLQPGQFQGYDLAIGLDMDGYTLAKRLDMPFIAYIHGIIADEAKFEQGRVRIALELQARAEQRSVNRADLVIATSQYSCQRLGKLYGYPASQIQIVPPPIDLSAWDAAIAAARQTGEDFTATRPTVLCVGVQYPRKNVATLIRAAALLRTHIPDLEVRIASKGPEWANLRRLTAELQLENTVTFLGHLSYKELVREYLRCQIFCLPSLQEGFGIVFAEAMATGKPIVASRSSSTPELIEDGIHGLLATPRDPEDLARKLARLLAAPEEAKQMGQAGRAKVKEFDVTLVAQQFSQLLSQMLISEQ